MKSTDVKFERYWYSLGYQINILSDGLLAKISKDPFCDTNKELRTLKELRDEKCLVLLGEKVMGKSFSINMEIDDLKKDGHNVFLLDLSAIGQKMELEEFLKNGISSYVDNDLNHNLYLYIDSFSQCQLQPSIIFDVLKNSLKNCNLDNVYFRFVFRPSYWNDSIKNSIIEITPSNKDMSVLRIAPLGVDIKKVFELESDEKRDAFIDWIETNALTPFLSIPKTLLYVVDIYKKGIKKSQSEIFKNCCYLLSGDSNGEFFNKDLLCLLGRVAAASIYNGDYVTYKADSNMRYQNRQTYKFGSSLFYTNSILNWSDLIESLKNPEVDEKKRIFEFLNDECKRIICEWKPGKELLDNEKVSMIEGLNELLMSRDLYNKEAFNNIIKKNQEIISLGLISSSERYVQFLNRKLLEDIFPKQITKSDKLEKKIILNFLSEIKLNDDLQKIDEIDLNEILDSGLFRYFLDDYSNESIEWMHSSFCEYLFALYLDCYIKDICEIEKIFLVKSNELNERRVYPQLRESAVWLAELKPQMFDKIFENDPSILFGSIPVITNDKFKQKMFDKLIDIVATAELPLIALNMEMRLGKLYFTGIEQKILKVLKENSDEQKSAAITIATKCKICDNKVQREILNISVNGSKPYKIRRDAARFLFYAASSQTKTLLRNHLISGIDFSNDEDDGIKGYVFIILWPDHITLAELITYLEQAKEMHVGLYSYFCNRIFHKSILKNEFTDKFSAEDINEAVIKLYDKYKKNDIEHINWMISVGIADYMIFLAWDKYDDLSEKDKFAEILLVILNCIYRLFDGNEQLKQMFNDSLDKHQERRYMLMTELLNVMNASNYNIRIHNFGRELQISSKDLEWMIKCLSNQYSDRIKEYLVDLIDMWFDRNNRKQVEKVYNLYMSNDFYYVKFKFGYCFEAIEIESEEAELSRKRENERIKWKKADEKFTKKNQYTLDDFNKEIGEELEQVESGNIQYIFSPPSFLENYEELKKIWIHYSSTVSSFDLSLIPAICGWGLDIYNRHWENVVTIFFKLDQKSKSVFPSFNNIGKLDCWQNIDSYIKSRIIDMAKRFIVDKKIDNLELKTIWFERNQLSDAARFGFHAFQLLSYLEPKFLETLDKEIWMNWSFTLLFCSDLADKDIKTTLNEYVYKYAKPKFKEYVLSVIDKEIRNYDTLFIINKLSDYSDIWISQALFNKLLDDNIKPSILRSILINLFERDYKPAYDFAMNKINEALKEEDINNQNADKLTATLYALLFELNREFNLDVWKKIWDLIKKDNQIGKNIFLELADKFGYYSSKEYSSDFWGFLRKVHINDLIEIYEYLSCEFPANEDPDTSGVYTVTTRHKIAEYRDLVGEQIIKRGSIESVLYFESQLKEKPEDLDLKYQLKKSKDNYYNKVWESVRMSIWIQ